MIKRQVAELQPRQVGGGKTLASEGEAHGGGDIDAINPTLKARQLWSFYEGTLTRARIENDPHLPSRNKVRGFVFDVATGQLREVR